MQDQAFTDDFRTQFDLLMRLRRDVRRFRTDPVDEAVLSRCLDAVRLAPSVGLSEPWRVIRVESKAARAAALKNFQPPMNRHCPGTPARRRSFTAA